MSKKRILHNTLIVMAGTLASRVLGVVRQGVLNNFFDKALTDAFLVAYRVPNLFREILAEGAVTNALIPVLAELPEGERARFKRRFAAFLLGVNLLVVGLGVLFAPQLAALLLAADTPLDPGLVTYLIRLVMPFLLAISMSALFGAFLQSEERFFGPSFAPLAYNVAAIAVMLAWPGSATALALAYVLGGFLQAAVQIPALKGFALELAWHPAIRQASLLMAPFVFTTSTRQFLIVVLYALITGMPEGAVTGFSNADMTYLMALGLFSVSPATALYPRLSALAAAGDGAGFARLLEQGLERVAVLLGWSGALMAALAPWIVAVLFAWKPGFDADVFRFSVEAMRALGLALVPWGLYNLYVRGLYAQKLIRVAVLISAGLLLLNTLGYYLLVPYGMFVLNLATLGAGLVGLVWMVVLYGREKVLEPARQGTLVLKVTLAMLAGGFAAAWTAAGVGPARDLAVSLLPLLAGAAAGSAVYFLAARLLGLPVRLGR
ncbi:integral membrane protein MviN [Oceanithermus profundus DSM 14977]|uniref:Integral membrane protein MviN n=1 Tax=Oceanithermus profundus (strain DSM 14977 / NBRC 100410 / VKM B-2274 / 506) TaxID=670487 RepID=E4U8K8_OCEP5|nr:murein biosynthesis integral membrane protein MurJ [Oceanithermus profundus]ADR36688.1 integral membrane protein MviN [Oceanithermus profundus DSM 14977]